MRGKAWQVTQVRRLVTEMNDLLRSGVKIKVAAEQLAKSSFGDRTAKALETMYHRVSERRPRPGTAKQDKRSELFLAVPKNGGTSGDVKYYLTSAEAAKALMAELDAYSFYRAKEVKLTLDVKEN